MTEQDKQIVVRINGLIKQMQWESAPFSRLLAEASICWPASLVWDEAEICAVEHPKYTALKVQVDAAIAQIEASYKREISRLREQLVSKSPRAQAEERARAEFGAGEERYP